MTAVQITLLGCGKMGSAMLRGWLADTSLNANFTIIEPNQDHLDWTKAYSQVNIYTDGQSAAADGAPASSLVVLAVKPQMMEDAITSIVSLCDSRTAFLTIAAGLSISWFKARLGNDAPILRAMPLQCCLAMKILNISLFSQHNCYLRLERLLS